MKEMIWSFSRLDTLWTCPYSFYSQYILKEEQTDNDWGIIGGSLHTAAEEIVKGNLAQEKAADYFYEGLPEISFPQFKPEYKDKLLGDCIHFLDNFPKIEAEVLDVERKFLIDIDGNKLRGYIDLELKDDKGIINLDWKTSSLSGFSGKKLRHKAKQLYLYAASTKEHFGEFPHTLRFYMVRGNKPIDIEFNKKDYQEALDWMKRVIEIYENTTEWEKKEQFFFCKNVCGTSSCEFNGNYRK